MKISNKYHLYEWNNQNNNYMTKKLFLALLLAMLSLGINAQSVGYKGIIDEYELQGSWVTDSCSGKIVSLDGVPEYFSLGQYASQLYGVSTDATLNEWFISNGNKLHWKLSDGKTIYFVIMNYDAGKKAMTLKTFDDACTMYVHQWQSATAISSAKIVDNNDTRKYDLQGRQVYKPKGVYIQGGQKFISK